MKRERFANVMLVMMSVLLLGTITGTAVMVIRQNRLLAKIRSPGDYTFEYDAKATEMAHLKKDAVTGHLLKNGTTGHLVKWCWEKGDDCTCCTGGTPKYFKVSPTGITSCGIAPIDQAWIDTYINGQDFVIQQKGPGYPMDPCWWSLSTTIDSKTVNVWLQCSAGVWHTRIQVATAGGWLYLYDDASIAGFTCTGTNNSTSDYVVGGCAGSAPGQGGYGGTATIVPGQ